MGRQVVQSVGSVDLVQFGNKVLVASPAQLQPFKDAIVLKINSPGTAEIVETNGFGNYGEEVILIADSAGMTKELNFAGTTMLPESESTVI
jgi:hypothetical protein